MFEEKPAEQNVEQVTIKTRKGYRVRRVLVVSDK